MDIGVEQEPYVIEPLTLPVPGEEPSDPSKELPLLPERAPEVAECPRS